ncbi:unnamed protein product [Chrysoparadoxa australica]
MLAALSHLAPRSSRLGGLGVVRWHNFKRGRNEFDDMAQQIAAGMDALQESSKFTTSRGRLRQPLEKSASASEPSRRQLQKRAQVHHALDEILGQDLVGSKRPPELLSIPGFPLDIADVKVSRDLRSITVFWSISSMAWTSPHHSMGRAWPVNATPEEQAKLEAKVVDDICNRLVAKTSFLTRKLCQKVNLKRPPKLHFKHWAELDVLTAAFYRREAGKK